MDTVPYGNESLYKYLVSVDDDFVDICSPLDQYFDIKFFAYSKIYFDGRYFFISNHLKYSKSLLQLTPHRNELFLEECMTFQSSLVPNPMVPFFWPEYSQAPNAQLLQNSGFWNGMDFARFNQDSLELWAFVGDKNACNMTKFYIQNQKVLLEFVHFFNGAAAKVIDCNNENREKLGFFKDAYQLKQKPYDKNICVAIDSFLEELRKKSRYLQKVKPDFFSLTRREQECLQYLALGNSAKEIAQRLDISNRTVECYITTIKSKTGFQCRSQLVKFFLENFS